MTYKEQEERDRHDELSLYLSNSIPELQDPLHDAIRQCREDGFTWGEIGFELFKMVQDAMYDIEQAEIKES